MTALILPWNWTAQTLISELNVANVLTFWTSKCSVIGCIGKNFSLAQVGYMIKLVQQASVPTKLGIYYGYGNLL